jgi:hypothetical protein
MSGILNVLLGDNAAAGGGATGKSIVLASASSQSLSRTWTASPTDGKKMTVSFFVKWVSITGDAMLYDGGPSSGSHQSNFKSGSFQSNKIEQAWFNGTTTYNVTSNSGFSDTTTWHHICIVFDSAQATAANRLIIYIDGVAESTYTDINYAPQNSDYQLTESGVTSWIGAAFYGAALANAKLAYYYLIDGQALAASNFTTGTGAGTTHPKTYAGTYGTNGFFLNFNNDTNDQSGNGNHWTANNSPAFDTDVPT